MSIPTMKKVPFSLLLGLVLTACQAGPTTHQTDQGPDSKTITQLTNEADPDFSFQGCFQLVESEGASKAVTFIILKVEGSIVNGEQAVEMTGPEYNAVAAGRFEGKLENGVITVVYDYEIEGSKQKEELEFKLVENGLMMTSSPLEDINGVLVPKQKGLFNRMIPKIDCP